MEAWDTLAAVEDGLVALGQSPGQAAATEHLGVVTHRLRGSASLSGFPQVAALAAAMEEAVERMAATPPEDRQALEAPRPMVASLQTAPGVLGDTAAENPQAIAQGPRH